MSKHWVTNAALLSSKEIQIFRTVALLCIRFYQRHLSPLKRFSCAYRVHTGRRSCSHLGYRSIRQYGLIGGISLLRRRTLLCGIAHRRAHPKGQKFLPLSQRGSCDLPCDIPCDGSGCDMPGSKSCNMGNYCNCCDACSWGNDGKKSKQKDDKTYLPPMTGRS